MTLVASDRWIFSAIYRENGRKPICDLFVRFLVLFIDILVGYLRSEADSMREAVFTVSPNKQ